MNILKNKVHKAFLNVHWDPLSTPCFLPYLALKSIFHRWSLRTDVLLSSLGNAGLGGPGAFPFHSEITLRRRKNGRRLFPQRRHSGTVGKSWAAETVKPETLSWFCPLGMSIIISKLSELSVLVCSSMKGKYFRVVRELGEKYIKYLVLKQQVIAANFSLGRLRILAYTVTTAPVLPFYWIRNALIPFDSLNLHILFLILHIVYKYYLCLLSINICYW